MIEDLRLGAAEAVLEYGPGTGVFTDFILRELKPDAKFAAIEVNPQFAAAFKARYPGVRLFQDTAANARDICNYAGMRSVDCIVSGLPWAALSKSTQVKCLDEMMHVLKPGGRIILVEPAITPLSWAFYRFVHPEPVDMRADPFPEGPKDPNRQPFDANQAIPTLLFTSRRRLMEERFPSLTIVDIEYLSLFAYPLSGGFRPWGLIPSFLVAPMLRLENALAPRVGKWMSFRLIAVLEKVARR